MFRKYLVWLVIGLFLSLNVFIAPSGIGVPSTSVDSHTGTILYVGGSGPGNFSCIQDAVDRADDGDTVFVFAGVYDERVVITRSITLVGQYRDTTIIDGGNGGKVVWIKADDVVVSNFTIQNAGKDISDAGVEIKNNGNYARISHNVILNCNNGISIAGADNVEISYNTIKYGVGHISPNGIRCSESYEGDNAMRVVIHDNHISHYDDGIALHEASDIRVFNNVISDNSGTGLFTSLSDHGHVYGNTIVDNGGCGIYLRGSPFILFRDWVVEDNDISYNAYDGIFVSGRGYGVKILRNLVCGNQRAGVDFHAMYFCSVKYNNLVDNEVNGFFQNLWFSSWRSNYWSGYEGSGPKLITGNQLGISWVFCDWFPAKEPYII